ncbi:intraflagellar transport protein 43 homolog A isoform X2 [Orussus abietinus]|uniref:intraflagellar transport protein 43 homolog A isoform X2 n=1 Tax=Orussus abietinus TaxID=222816 RepID=UPI00062515D0|nr:intraflagellar transport protein 43 homolog A isoform X2 [Orussus abietinus]
MDWSTDLDLSAKKLMPKLGRRAGQSNTQDDFKSDDDLLDSPLSLSDKSSRTTGPVAPPRTRKTGWGDELKSGKMKITSNIIEQERSRAVEKDEPEDEIPVIPDLDEIQEDNVLTHSVNAPSVGVNRVAAYKELDTELLRSTALASLDDVNLSLLAEKLYPDKLVREPDDIWSWDLLFTQIASEINGETEKKTEL